MSEGYMGGGERVEQLKMNIRDSNVLRIGFLKCTDCEEQYVCPHTSSRKGCRTKEVLKEICLEEKGGG